MGEEVTATVSFVSDAGRPGVCQSVECGHAEIDHDLDGPCHICNARNEPSRPDFFRACQRYDPVRYFQDPEDGP